MRSQAPRTEAAHARCHPGAATGGGAGRMGSTEGTHARTQGRPGMGSVQNPLEFRLTLNQWGANFRVEFDRFL